MPFISSDPYATAHSFRLCIYSPTCWAGAGVPSVPPADPYERAVARFWVAYVDDKVGSAWQGMLFTCRSEEERAVARAVAALETLEDALAEGEKLFFGGDGIRLMDIVLGGYLGWFGAVDRMIVSRLIDPARTPLLARWEDRFRASEAAKGVVPDEADKMLEFLPTLLALNASKSK